MAATGTPTPNIGLRRPQGTDPASVDDINYNSNLIDTKLGAVGNTSVQAQINSLNSKMPWKFIVECDNNTKVEIPSEWNEVFIIGTENTLGSFAVWETASFIIPHIDLTTYHHAVGATGAKAFSYFSTSSTNSITVGNGNSSLSTCVKYRVYYR